MKKIIIIAVFAITIASVSNAHPFEDSPFGFHPASVGHPGYDDNGFIDAENIGIKWTRQGTYAFWFLVQPDTSDTTLDFAMYDAQWLRVPDSINILANIVPQGRIDEGYCLPGSFLPIDSIKYVRFVKATIERYDGDGIDDMPGLTNPIKYWQVGNEPNNTATSDFAKLQRITYCAIKDADSTVRVLIGGATSFPYGYVHNFDGNFAPILTELAGNYVDIFDFHWYGTASGEYRLKDTESGDDVLEHIRATLIANGFSPDIPIWITEMGSYSGDPTRVPDICPFQTERQQAGDYLKRFIYPLSRGIEKIFPAFGLMEGFKLDSGYFDYTGLIYDDWGSYDLGLGVKKLGYYTFKKMTEKLEGSDWDSVETVIDSIDNCYAYCFTRSDTQIYVAWWDYFNDPLYIEGDTNTIILTDLTGDSIAVTDAVPHYTNGSFVTDYATAFTITYLSTSGDSAIIPLGKNPVFIEEIGATGIAETSLPRMLEMMAFPNPFNSAITISLDCRGLINR